MIVEAMTIVDHRLAANGAVDDVWIRPMRRQ
jgi:hypothetical protein